MALEYVFRTRDATTAVFWVYASDCSRFVDSYKRIAVECQIPGQDDPELDTLTLVRNWLETKYRFRWLMIIDNVDDRTNFFERTGDITVGKALIEYIPQTAAGSVIYTTRNRDVGLDLTLGDEPITVPPLSIAEGLTMFGNQIRRGNNTEDELLYLLEELSYLPLAISQATAFMLKRRKTVADYIRLLQGESTKPRVLDHRSLHHGRETRGSESIISVWSITFQYIKTANPRSAQLLALMSLLDRQEIPLAVLQDPAEDSFDFEEAVGLLEAFSLITVYPSFEVCDQAVIDSLYYEIPNLNNPCPNFCDMHRLVQTSTREWVIQLEENRSATITQAITAVAVSFPSGFYETWPVCRLIYPHADALLRYTSDDMTDPSDISDGSHVDYLWFKSVLLHKLSTYSRQQGDLRLSENRARMALQIRQSMFPSEEEELLDSMHSLALTIDCLGKCEEAYQMQRQVLVGREKVLGPDHRQILEALNQLGSTLKSRGAYAEAEILALRELSGKKKLLEQEPADTGLIEDVIIALNNLASVLNHQGEHLEALRLLHEGLDRCQAMPSVHHVDLLISESLGITHGLLGNFEDAEVLFKRVLSGREEAYGKCHPTTLITRGQYASMLQTRGKHAEVEDILIPLIEDKIVVHGNRAHDVWSDLHNLGMVLHRQKKHREAESTLRRLLKYQEDASQPWTDRAPNISSSLHGIKVSLEAQGKVGEASEIKGKIQTHEMLSKPPAAPLLAEENLTEAKKLHRSSHDFFNQGLFQEAEATARSELEIHLETDSLDSEDDIQDCRLFIARTLHEQRKYVEAQAIARDVVRQRERFLGWRRVETRDALAFLAASLLESGLFDEAEERYRTLLHWVQNQYGPLVLATYHPRMGLGYAISRQGRKKEAEELYRINLGVQLEYEDEGKPEELPQAHHNLACTLWDQKHFEDAEAHFNLAHKLRVELFGTSDARSMKTLLCLADLAAEQGNVGHAASLYLLSAENTQLPDSDDEDEY